MKRFCYTLDLKDNHKLKNEYIKHHENVWPEIIKSMKESGIIKAEIYNVKDRLFLLIVVENLNYMHHKVMLYLR